MASASVTGLVDCREVGALGSLGRVRPNGPIAAHPPVRMRRVSYGEVIGGVAKSLGKILYHFLQSAYFMKELQSLGKQHVVEQGAHARRSLGSCSLKVRRIEWRGVGDRSVVFGVLGQGTQQASELPGQQLAEARSYAHSLARLAGVSQLSQFDSLIKGHAQHGVAAFQFVDLLVENL